MLPRLRANVLRAHRLGVKIVTGADTGYAPNSTTRVGQEIANLVEIGLTPVEALRCATTNAAEMLRLEQAIGAVEAGLRGRPHRGGRQPARDREGRPGPGPGREQRPRGPGPAGLQPQPGECLPPRVALGEAVYAWLTRRPDRPDRGTLLRAESGGGVDPGGSQGGHRAGGEGAVASSSTATAAKVTGLRASTPKRQPLHDAAQGEGEGRGRDDRGEGEARPWRTTMRKTWRAPPRGRCERPSPASVRSPRRRRRHRFPPRRGRGPPPRKPRAGVNRRSSRERARAARRCRARRVRVSGPRREGLAQVAR